MWDTIPHYHKNFQQTPTDIYEILASTSTPVCPVLRWLIAPHLKLTYVSVCNCLAVSTIGSIYQGHADSPVGISFWCRAQLSRSHRTLLSCLRRAPRPILVCASFGD